MDSKTKHYSKGYFRIIKLSVMQCSMALFLYIDKLNLYCYILNINSYSIIKYKSYFLFEISIWVFIYKTYKNQKYGKFIARKRLVINMKKLIGLLFTFMFMIVLASGNDVKLENYEVMHETEFGGVYIKIETDDFNELINKLSK